MPKIIHPKIKQAYLRLNLFRTLTLVWSASKKRSVLSVFLIIIETFSLLIAIAVFKKIINTVVAKGIDQPAIIQHVSICFAVVLTLTVIYIILKSVNSFISERQADEVGTYISDKINECAIALDLAFYESPEYFNVMQRAKDAGADKPRSVVIGLMELIRNIIMLMAIIIVIITINSFLLLLLVLFIAPSFYVRITLARKLRLLNKNQTDAERRTAYWNLLITGNLAAKEIKSYNLGEHFKHLYLNCRLALLESKYQIIRHGAYVDVLTNVFSVLGFFACMGYMFYSTIKGHCSVGDITVFLVVFPQSYSVLQSLSSSIGRLYQDSIFINYIFELLDLKSNLKEKVPADAIPPISDLSLSINSISFTYPNTDKQVLKNISMKIPRGKIIGIIGTNGSGKSSLIKLLCRLYDPDMGGITLGGVDIRNFNSHVYRQQISVVFQDFVRYNTTVADNIRYGDIDKPHRDSDLLKAAQYSGAESFINELPAGYDTMMGNLFEDGKEISIGQWQKLAIARAFYASTNFVIFDEATSALDPLAEQHVFDTLRESLGSRGALIISHRLSAVKYADYIYVMANGEVTHEGTHAELIKNDSDYAALFINNTPAIA